uniref:lipopolysaccharide heptosyltransferase II n=1 Tax=Thermorudis sp. TaxID=1969470 RepID=A0A7C2WID8_9BACT
MSWPVTRQRQAWPPWPQHPERILVIKPCCLGDVLMATPALRALHLAFPQASIDVAVTAWAAPVLDGNPRLRRLVRYPDRATPQAALRLGLRLRRERYQLGIGLDRSPVVNLLLWLAGIPVRAGIDSQRRGLLLTHRARPRPGQHETELSLEVLGQLGIEPQGLHPEYEISLEAQESVRHTLAGLGIQSGARALVVIHPGGAVNPGTTMLSKRWPPERYAELIDRLVVDHGVAVVLVGGSSDREAVEAVKQAARSSVYDLCEQLSLPELAALCAEAQLFVGNDSGVSHLAAAVGTPTVTIFGPTSPLQYRPLGPRSRVCAPEASWRLPTGVDLRRGQREDPALDIRQVTVDEVYGACAHVLGQAATRC